MFLFIGTMIVVRAIKIGVIDELCRGNQTNSSSSDSSNPAERGEAPALAPPRVGGVALFDRGSSQKLGGGRLQDYLINSNTFGSKFVSNVVMDRPGMLPPEISTNTALEALRQVSVCWV